MALFEELSVGRLLADSIKLGGTLVTATAAQLNRLVVTAGVVTASKAVVVDANKDAGDFRDVTAVNYDAGASGTAGTVDVFPSTASKGKLSFSAADSAGNTTTTVTNASQSGARTYTIPDAGASANFVMTNSGTVTLSTNAGTISKLSGKITTEALTTAAGASETLTITNTLVAPTDIILLTFNGGASDAGTPQMSVIPGAGSFAITLNNRHASAAFNGTFIIGFQVIKV